MRHQVNVFRGKIRDYEGSRPSAIAKLQVQGELTLTELGLAGDEQAEKSYHGGADRALCHYPREHYTHWAQASRNRPHFSARPPSAKTSLPSG